MLHPVSFKTIITINVTNSTQKLQIDYKNTSGKLQRNYCEITKNKMCKLYGTTLFIKKVVRVYYFSHIRNELVPYRISLVKSCF